MFNRRIFVLNYHDEDMPKFKSQKEIDDWYHMLGRMLAYSMFNPASEDTVTLVTGSIHDKGAEMCMTYHAAIPEYPEKWEDGSTKALDSTASLINDTLKTLADRASAKHRGFTMAAIKREDGYSLHS